MRKFLLIGLMSGLAACSGGSASVSSLNPFTWGSGRSGTEIAPRGGYDVASRDLRPFVDQVTRLSVERTPNGLIITATGVPPTQGWYFAELVPVPTEDASTAAYQFKVTQPLGTTGVGPVRSRQITAGAFLTNLEAAGIRTITVQAARNSQSVRR